MIQLRFSPQTFRTQRSSWQVFASMLRFDPSMPLTHEQQPSRIHPKHFFPRTLTGPRRIVLFSSGLTITVLLFAVPHPRAKDPPLWNTASNTRKNNNAKIWFGRVHFDPICHCSKVVCPDERRSQAFSSKYDNFGINDFGFNADP